MAVQATNYDKDKEYLIAEIKDVPRQNLLINGDLKINQRGKSSYVGTTDVTYSLDMWYLSYATLTVNDGYITVKGRATGNFQQVVDKNLTGNTVILIVKEKDKIPHTISGVCDPSTPITKNTGTFTMSIDYKESINKYKVNLKVSSEINLEYIALYEGDIDYKHIPEDDATAMMRCLPYLYKGQLTGVMYGNASTSDYWYAGVSVYPLEMASIPTVTYDLISIPNIGTLQPGSIVSAAVTTRYLGGTIRVNTGQTSVIQPTTYPRYPLTLRFTLSCEPQ